MCGGWRQGVCPETRGKGQSIGVFGTVNYRIEFVGDALAEGQLPFEFRECLGVGYIVLEPSQFWTGNFHLNIHGKISIQLCEVRLVETRSNLDETDEDWRPVFKYDKCKELRIGFYKYWNRVCDDLAQCEGS